MQYSDFQVQKCTITYIHCRAKNTEGIFAYSLASPKKINTLLYSSSLTGDPLATCSSPAGLPAILTAWFKGLIMAQ